jgi:ABC-type multidrug transport system ATPase subunit
VTTNLSISVEHLIKSYGDVQAVKDVSFDIPKGELFGLIGPDGAGKTTIFRIIATLLIPEKGKVLVEGLDVVKDYKKIRDILGYMAGRFSLYQDLSVQENLEFYATIFGTTVKENYYLIKDIYLQLEPFKTRLAGKLSGGMKQKLALCCALIHKPSVLILDEPTTGVDAVSRMEFWEILSKLKQEGITIIVSTPYMDEAALCERVALIQSGNIMAIDQPANITKEFSRTLYAVRSDHIHKLILDLEGYEFTNSVHLFGHYLHYTDKRTGDLTGELSDFMKLNGHSGTEIKIIPAVIEDCFMEYMKNHVS